MKKVYIIYPIQAYSTREVAHGLVKGFEANGIEVDFFDFFKRYEGLKNIVGTAFDKKKFEAFDRRKVISFVDECILQNVAEFDPDFVLVIQGVHIYPEIAKTITKYFKTGVFLTDEPYEHDFDEKFVDFYDYVFCNDRSALTSFDREIHFIGSGYDSEIFGKTNGIHKDLDVSFVGTVFPERLELLKKLDLQEEGVRFYFGGGWEDECEKDNWVFQNFLLRLHSMEEINRMYLRSKIVLNPHRDNNSGGFNKKEIEGQSLNQRTFEALASGSHVFVDRQDSVSFDGLIYYEDGEDLKIKMDNVLSDWKSPDNHGIENHDYIHKSGEILEIIK